ncbi:GGDEF domain-containing protein [Aquibacillus rhizosphaerae]|uniref:GGDEF domain-containing protein n=1 Tax=Aquibacillus rhizosphaerae TaxID=3051431 RepID=A0ABT7LCA3_9BACI|nr:GGDEF domain-containing protein [Aquibacillus sp. LR5S19]MDL4842215.1 GGDEF domain-containing protein [Aquibacillus sp. LR5S19]
MNKRLNKFEEFKRKLYLFVLPLLIISSLISLLYIDESESLNTIILPLLASGFCVSLILIYTRKGFRYVELANLLLISLFHLLKVFEIVSLNMVTQEEVTTGNATYWTPLLFVFIFVTLKARNGWIYSLVLWALTLAIGIYYWNDIPYFGSESLIQYYLSNLVYIIFLFFARHIISAYTESEVLEKMAFYDALTGIANRRKVYQWLEESLDKDNQFSVIFFDLDYFKKINDEFGHVAGDKVLIEVSELVKRYIRSDDFFGRWGGEEFIIVSRNRDKIEALRLAEQLRKEIENHSFLLVKKVTSSFGVAVSEKGDTTESMLDRVDDVLYMAKEQGRNQVKVL